MKVLAINSSPRSSSTSKTVLMLNSLIGGMIDNGARVEVVNLYKKKIKSCTGCEHCTTKTPGKCIFQDDMSDELYDKWATSDIVVYASPLYHNSLNSKMKTFVERTYPILSPMFNYKDGRVTVSFRHRHPKLVILSVGAFPGISNFDPVKAWAHHMFDNFDRNEKILIGELYRPMAQGLTNPLYQALADDVLEAAYLAGMEIIQSQSISEQTQWRVSQPFTADLESYYRIANCVRKTCMEHQITSQEMGRKGIVPRPETMETYITIAKQRFLGKNNKGDNGTIKFYFEDLETSPYSFVIENGTFKVVSDRAQQADLTIETTFENWMDVITKRADTQSLAKANKIRFSGEKKVLELLS